MSTADEELRAALRARLECFIDRDDDTMPALNRVDGGFTWVPTESTVDELMKVVGPLQQMYLAAMTELGRAVDKLDSQGQQQFPIASHAYQGEGFLYPCTAKGYGTACGESEYDHAEAS
ncbi:hypothetical protein [Streptomyces sp. NRRL S-813]|uniref:hypothetical protein n=1 Tax=Streptomyces sp. NRRL S-813 TaxID=1463919 RepID=UPI0004BFEE5B|nr:hypothetical protein [Streptomyces sp. NRRL S-813]